MAKVQTKSLMDIHPREIKGIVKEIPTLPVIYQELFSKMQDPDVSVSQLANIISQDQALSAKILHLVNSAFYGYSKQINTISRAVVILGFRAVRSAALATSVFDFFGDEESSSTLDMTKFWTHSIAVAAICKVLAVELKINQQEEAFVGGLLHDAGKLIEKRYFAADFNEVCRVASEQHLTWFECEKALFQVNHAIIGKVVFRNWDFPASVVDAVHCHHLPQTSSNHPQLAALIHVGDYLSYQYGLGAPGAFSPACDSSSLKLLNLTLVQAASFKDKIQEELDHSMEILNLIN